jgi:hypothetical protein
MADALGATTESAIGLTCYEAVHGENAPPPFCPHAKLLADGKPHAAEVFEKRLQGVFDVSATPLLSPVGDLVGSVHVAHDITERKRAEEELKQQHLLHKALNDILTKYAHGHDIREVSDGSLPLKQLRV